MKPTIALTAKWFTYPDRLNWILGHDFALEYAPDPQHLDQLPQQISPFLTKSVPVRFHGFLPGYEIGHADPKMAAKGLRGHKAVLDAIQGLGEPVLTIHVGLKPDDPIDPQRAIENLAALVAHGNALGITVCLENLRRGYTSHPEIVANWAEKTGAAITLDLGHAASCDDVKTGKCTSLDFIAAFADKLHEIHLYGTETDRHHPPQNITEISSLLDQILQTHCQWWTIELDDYEEVLFTRQMVLEYLKEDKIR